VVNPSVADNPSVVNPSVNYPTYSGQKFSFFRTGDYKRFEKILLDLIKKYLENYLNSKENCFLQLVNYKQNYNLILRDFPNTAIVTSTKHPSPYLHA